MGILRLKRRALNLRNLNRQPKSPKPRQRVPQQAPVQASRARSLSRIHPTAMMMRARRAARRVTSPTNLTNHLINLRKRAQETKPWTNQETTVIRSLLKSTLFILYIQTLLFIVFCSIVSCVLNLSYAQKILFLSPILEI